MSSPSSAKDDSNVSRTSVPAMSVQDSTISLYRDPSFASLGTSSSGQDEFFSCLEHAETALKQMETYFENQQLCDVVLIAGVDGKRWVAATVK